MFGLSLFRPSRQSNPSQCRSHVRQRKIQISPPSGEPDWSNALPQGQQRQSNPPAAFTLIGAYLFYFVFEGNFPCTSPWAAYIWRGDLTESFWHYRFEGFILFWRGVHVFSDFYGIHKLCIFVNTWKLRQKTSPIPFNKGHYCIFWGNFVREKSSCCYLTCMGLYVTKSGMLPERPKKLAQKLLKTFLSQCFSKFTQCLDQEQLCLLTCLASDLRMLVHKLARSSIAAHRKVAKNNNEQFFIKQLWMKTELSYESKTWRTVT